jgi:SAM-dependent methyltransferase
MFTAKDSDKHWERYGQIDPYYGVVSVERFKSENLTEGAIEEFFDSGRAHLDEVLETIRRHVDPDFAPQSALDFGCGVGRMVIPLSSIAERVVGLDVSEAMIAEARKNVQERGTGEVRFYQQASEIPVGERFDLIHSFIVFQHIPVKRGEKIFRDLLDRLSSGGVAALHFTYTASAWARLVHWTLRNIPFAWNLYNLLSGKQLTYPIMQSNFYQLNRLFAIIQERGVERVHLEFTRHKRNSGVMLYIRREELVV